MPDSRCDHHSASVPSRPVVIQADLRLVFLLRLFLRLLPPDVRVDLFPEVAHRPVHAVGQVTDVARLEMKRDRVHRQVIRAVRTSIELNLTRARFLCVAHEVLLSFPWGGSPRPAEAGRGRDWRCPYLLRMSFPPCVTLNT